MTFAACPAFALADAALADAALAQPAAAFALAAASLALTATPLAFAAIAVATASLAAAALPTALAAAGLAAAVSAAYGSHRLWLCGEPTSWAMRAKHGVRWHRLLQQRGLHNHQPASGSHLGHIV